MMMECRMVLKAWRKRRQQSQLLEIRQKEAEQLKFIICPKRLAFVCIYKVLNFVIWLS